MLMEHETQKIKELDEQYQTELREWKGQLRPRKQVRPPRILFGSASSDSCLKHIFVKHVHPT